MKHPAFPRTPVLLGLIALVGLTACSDSPTAPVEPDPEPVAAEVFLRGTQERLAYVHGDHWHGGIDLELGEEIEVDVRFLDENEEVIPLVGGYSVQAELVPGATQGIISVSAHGDHLDIEAEAPGETHILIHFWHGDHADWSTPPLRVTVGEPAGGDPEPVSAEVYLRGTDERLAYMDGDHWHGGIDLEVGEEIEVDVRFLDENDQVIELGGEYTVQAELAPDAAEGIISIEAHGDHLDIQGEAAGETQILIHFWHDDHADWTTPPLTVVVNE